MSSRWDLDRRRTRADVAYQNVVPMGLGQAMAYTKVFYKHVVSC